MMCPCRCITCNKGITLVEDVGNVGDYAWGVGQEIYGKSLYLPLNFAASLPLL